jgi:hypothetical protein
MLMKNLQFHTAANRAATARSGNDLANFKRFFNGAATHLSKSTRNAQPRALLKNNSSRSNQALREKP